MLLICRYDYWPGLTPDRLWEIPYDRWAALALAVDKIHAQRQRAEADASERMKAR